MTKRYENYVNKLTGKIRVDLKELCISLPKVDFPNVEPWCMVHELYRCFCGGKYLTRPSNREENITTAAPGASDFVISNIITENKDNEIKQVTENVLNEHTFKSTEDTDEIIDVGSDRPVEITTKNRYNAIELQNNSSEMDGSASCSRTTPFLSQNHKHEKRLQLTNTAIPKQSTKQPPNLLNLSNFESRNFPIWLEKGYKFLKEQMDAGKSIVFYKPTPRCISLFPWSALMKRYQERSNYFLMNQSPPHRVVISINPSNKDFDNYIDITKLKLEDLPNLPEFVKRLVTKKDAKDDFVLLRASLNCWQILGVVSKNTSTKSVTSPEQVHTEISPQSETEKFANDIEIDHQPSTSFCLPKEEEYCTKISETAAEFPATTLTQAIKSNEYICHDVLDLTTSEKDKFSRKSKTSKNNKTNNYRSTEGLEMDSESIIRSHSSRRKQNFSSEEESKQNALNQTSQHNSNSVIGTSEDTQNYNSKWFVMTVENDFTELKFFKKNVFVTYKTIISAIELARTSNQTVILPLLKVNDGNPYKESGPQFGIYAIPVNDKACVLVGPYKKYEDLCMKTVKTDAPVSNKSTRGVWLYTKNVDNSNVLENPLSYLPNYSSNKVIGNDLQKNKSGIKRTLQRSENVKTTPNKKIKVVEPLPILEQTDLLNKQEVKKQDLSSTLNVYLDPSKREATHGGVLLQTTVVNPENTSGGVVLQKTVVSPENTPAKIQPIKIIKPITIKRSNGFYQLAPSGVLKPISLLKSSVRDGGSSSGIVVPMQLNPTVSSTPLITKITSLAQPQLTTIEPVKLTSILKTVLTAPEAGKTENANKAGFFILNPDEINNKAHKLREDVVDITPTQETEIMEVFNLDSDDDCPPLIPVKNEVMDSSALGHCEQYENITSNESEVYVLSDDEPPDSTEPKPDAEIQVMLKCKNIPNLGCIRGRLNTQNKVSFQFPGFKFTDFYSIEEASTKINQVLSRKVCVPKSIKPQWRPETGPNKLMAQLGPDLVLTKSGLITLEMRGTIHQDKPKLQANQEQIIELDEYED